MKGGSYLAHTGAFDGILADPLPGRSGKPRTHGETMVIDKGLGLSATRDLLEMASDYIDYMKLAFGTAGLCSAALLKAKLSLIRSYDVAVYPGGTYLEAAILQGRVQAFLERAQTLGFTHIDMSEASKPSTPSVVRGMISSGRVIHLPDERWRLGRTTEGLFVRKSRTNG